MENVVEPGGANTSEGRGPPLEEARARLTAAWGPVREGLLVATAVVLRGSQVVASATQGPRGRVAHWLERPRRTLDGFLSEASERARRMREASGGGASSVEATQVQTTASAGSKTDE